MTHDPLADVVSRQYERWVYPEPIRDLESWLQGTWQWFDPSHAHRLLWPDRDYDPGMDILVAGCGTNQAAVIAYTNPSARVVAIDVSDASLDHHRWLAGTYGLTNLELHQLPIEEVASLDEDFDLIITTGVLHHLADPAIGMRALGERLRPDGVLAVMLYADYGRIGVQMMQGVFRDMGLTQDEASLAMVRDALQQLGPRHPLASYLEIAPDLGDDAGLVDTFLHGREHDYTIDECRDLVESAGLVFQDIFLKASYYAPRGSSSAFFAAVAAMPRERQWSIMQRINAANACHYFLACRPERSPESYAIDFDAGNPSAYVPSFRKGCGLSGVVLSRHDWQVTLTPLQAALVERVDGRASIAEITAGVQRSGAFARSQEDVVAASFETFRSLWQLDFLAMGIR
ncbi:MAG: class I SAM-dependent methyltransferase [Candidatus Nanopelagicales bacterium]